MLNLLNNILFHTTTKNHLSYDFTVFCSDEIVQKRKTPLHKHIKQSDLHTWTYKYFSNIYSGLNTTTTVTTKEDKVNGNDKQKINGIHRVNGKNGLKTTHSKRLTVTDTLNGSHQGFQSAKNLNNNRSSRTGGVLMTTIPTATQPLMEIDDDLFRDVANNNCSNCNLLKNVGRSYR